MLVLAHAAADRRQFVAARGSREVSLCLGDAHHAPSQDAEHLPPPQFVDRERRARLVVVGVEQLLAKGEKR